MTDEQKAVADKALADNLRFNDERNALFLGQDWLSTFPVRERFRKMANSHPNTPMKTKTYARPRARADHERQIMSQIGGTIREARRKSGFSLPQLAEAAGVGKGHLSTIERGARGDVGILTLFRICRALDLHPRYVLPDFKI